MLPVYASKTKKSSNNIMTDIILAVTIKYFSNSSKEITFALIIAKVVIEYIKYGIIFDIYIMFCGKNINKIAIVIIRNITRYITSNFIFLIKNKVHQDMKIKTKFK